MTKTLLLDGDGLRSALDVPWTGLFLDLLSSGRADSDAEDHGLEFIDAPCGGGSLRVYGVEGKSTLETVNNLAIVLKQQGKLNEAKAMYCL